MRCGVLLAVTLLGQSAAAGLAGVPDASITAGSADVEIPDCSVERSDVIELIAEGTMTSAGPALSDRVCFGPPEEGTRVDYWPGVVVRHAESDDHREREPTGADTASGAGRAADVHGSPTGLALSAPWPNPARGRVSMRLVVPGGHMRPVEVRVHDVAGRLVRAFPSGAIDSGHQAVNWDLRDGRGERVSSGIYFVRMTVGSEETARRIVVLR